MKILAFAASNSMHSINREFVEYVTARVQDMVANTEVTHINIYDYEMPIMSLDREAETGIPQAAHDFYQRIGDAELLIVSFAEHNSNFSAAYKNLFDWTSRINSKPYQKRPLIALATSPGKRGGQNVLDLVLSTAERFGAETVGSFSLPSFHENFDAERKTINDAEILSRLTNMLNVAMNQVQAQ